MDKSKIKNFIIILLALVNFCLLFIVISGDIEERNAAAFRTQALVTVLSEHGIKLNPNIDLPESIPPLLSLKRDLGTEKDRISALIGSCTAEDQGGNSYYYQGEDGNAEFSGTGEFNISMNAGAISTGKDPVASAKAALNKLNIQAGDIDPIVTDDGTNTTVTLYCSWDGTSIYNAKIDVIFNSDYLWLISGVRPLDTKYLIKSSENYPDSVTILMKFLKFVNDTGYVCSEINDLTIVYNMYSAVSENCTLRPVWCVKTDSGLYYIDAATGQAEIVESAV
ncbi:MAG: hypothetical protein KBI01_06800 [Oscillospiraceae bacterium]|nr:hypothetical protein [Oscillospiraceae bacterium]